jgi:hypothetical protein
MKSPDSGFTGIAFRGDGLSLYWKGPLDNGMLAAINKAREFGPVEIVPAAFSLVEMEAEAEKLDKAAKKLGGSDIQAVTTRYDGSGLDIERMPFGAADKLSLARVSAGQRSLRSAEQVLAGLDLRIPVRVTTADAPIELLVDRYNDTPPWNSGGFYVTKRSGQIRGRCTTGFGIRAYGRTWVLASAHCGTPPDVAYHGSALKYMGPVTRENYRYDLMLIDAPGFYRMFEGSCNNCYRNVVGWENTVSGEYVFYSGVYTYGIGLTGSSTNITVPSASPDSDGDWGYTIYSLIKTDQIPVPEVGWAANPVKGDSGAPVFVPFNASAVVARGSLSAGASGGKFYFQDWADVSRIYGGEPVTP